MGVENIRPSLIMLFIQHKLFLLACFLVIVSALESQEKCQKIRTSVSCGQHAYSCNWCNNTNSTGYCLNKCDTKAMARCKGTLVIFTDASCSENDRRQVVAISVILCVLFGLAAIGITIWIARLFFYNNPYQPVHLIN